MNATLTTVNKIPIIIVGFGHAASGFSRVVHSIAKNLAHCYEIHHLAVNLRSQVNVDYGWKIYANDIKYDVNGQRKLRKMIEEIKPKLVWILNDFWYLAQYYKVLEEYEGRIKKVAYMPLDGRIVRASYVGSLMYYDVVVVYTGFARRELAAALNEAAVTSRGLEMPEIEVIPHGVDIGTFSPLSSDGNGAPDPSSRKEAKQMLFDKSINESDSFIILNANQNHFRKCLDLTLEGFAQFAKGKPPGVKLYLHSATEPGKGIRSLDLIRHLGIEERLILTCRGAENPNLPDSELNVIYNACDLGINTSWGEGWGLVSFEHAAAGAAQIVPRHTACEELWNEAAEFLEVEEIIRNSNMILEARKTSSKAVAESLERLYQDRKYLERMAEHAFRRATRPEYLWENVALQWDKLFKRLLDS